MIDGTDCARPKWHEDYVRKQCSDEILWLAFFRFKQCLEKTKETLFGLGYQQFTVDDFYDNVSFTLWEEMSL